MKVTKKSELTIQELSHMVHNRNIKGTKPMPTPADLKKQFKMTREMCQTVLDGRQAVEDILLGKDSRFLIAAGPCSMHDRAVYLEYTERSVALAEQVSDVLLLIQRANPLKPRSESNGWRGMATDHGMNGRKDLAGSCRAVREIMTEAVRMGAHLATEMMDPNYYQFWDDLPVFAWIGADNCTNTRIREVCSGLSCPVGCKHPKQLGSLISAVRALGFVSTSNTFLAQNDVGRFTEFTSEGNTGCIIHRGYELQAGKHESNYSPRIIASSHEMLVTAGLNTRKMVDLNHSNSGKDHTKQCEVLDSVLAQRAEGNADLVGVVWEVNLEAGKQAMPENLDGLKWGVSVTDACDSFATMEKKVLEVADTLRGEIFRASLQPH